MEGSVWAGLIGCSAGCGRSDRVADQPVVGRPNRYHLRANRSQQPGWPLWRTEMLVKTVLQGEGDCLRVCLGEGRRRREGRARAGLGYFTGGRAGLHLPALASGSGRLRRAPAAPPARPRPLQPTLIGSSLGLRTSRPFIRSLRSQAPVQSSPKVSWKQHLPFRLGRLGSRSVGVAGMSGFHP